MGAKASRRVDVYTQGSKGATAETPKYFIEFYVGWDNSTFSIKGGPIEVRNV